MEKLVKFITSAGGIGYLRGGGTLASLAGLVLASFFLQVPDGYLFLLTLSIMAGFLLVGRAEVLFNEKDSRKIVIDEVVGVLFAFFHVPFQLFYLAVGFMLYRVFDIAKIYPARKIEEMAGATGVMGDDILAGLYTNAILSLINLAFIRLNAP